MKLLILTLLVVLSPLSLALAATTPNLDDPNLALNTDKSAVEANPNVVGEVCACKKNAAPCKLTDNTNPPIGGGSSPSAPRGTSKGVGG